MKSITLILTVFFSFLSSTNAIAQEESKHSLELKAHSISLNLIGSPSWPIGFSYGQMLNNRVSVELGVGLLSSGAGIDFYITNPRHHQVNLNTGIYGSVNYDGFPMFYIPVGVSYLGKKNIQFNFNAGVLYAENVSITEAGGNISPWFGLTIGKRFGPDIQLVKDAQNTKSKNIVYLKLGALDPWVGIGYERLLSPNISVEATIGLLGIAAGANLYFPSIKPGKIGFKSGLIHGWSANPFDLSTKGYVPLGINYLSKSNVSLCVDAGPAYWYDSGEVLVSFNLKVGKAF